MSFKPYAASAPAAVDRALKHPHLIERVLHSSYASSSLLSIGSSDGTLRSYEMDERASIARWQATHKRLFHSSCAFLDHWGVFITILDSRLKVFDLPLQMGDSGVARDDTKGAALFAVHEEVKTLWEEGLGSAGYKQWQNAGCKRRETAGGCCIRGREKDM
uniref:Anaphase-promoting complex subunit 4 WD40 domain-containing protein n=1 Tax=Hyaloperonospora arabidopsidis (strain Emoy2) TaxID=559515 RepID=M4BMQ5_HYAAE